MIRSEDGNDAASNSTKRSRLSQGILNNGNCCSGGWVNQFSASTRRPNSQEEVQGFNAAAQSEDDVDKLLVREMTQLSITERNRIYEDLHSVPDEIQETEEFVADHLKRLDAELNRIREKPAYQLAYIMNEKYVTNRDFRLMFLRSARFDVEMAAKKTIAFFERKLELFGQDKLVKEIFQEDLSDEDLACGRRGAILLLDQPDKAGRPVFIFCQQNTEFRAPENMIRYTWYHNMTLLRDFPGFQTKGHVGVMYLVGVRGAANPKSFDYFMKFSKDLIALPIKATALHFCYDNPVMKPIMTVVKIAGGKDYRVRSRVHYGSHQEVVYELLSYGIPISDVFFQDDVGGAIRVAANKTLDRFRKREEELKAQIPPNKIEYPLIHDVLFGRGTGYYDFSGNKEFMKLLDDYQELYENAKRLNKPLVSKQVIDAVQKAGGRFLKRENGEWVEVSFLEARDKVAHGFRSRRLLAKKGKLSSSSSSVGHKRPRPVNSSDSVVPYPLEF